MNRGTTVILSGLKEKMFIGCQWNAYVRMCAGKGYRVLKKVICWYEKLEVDTETQGHRWSGYGCFDPVNRFYYTAVASKESNNIVPFPNRSL